MRQNYTLPRLYIDAELSDGAKVELSREQAHYLGTVIRKGQGDAVRIFNAEHGEWRAEISFIGKRVATLTVLEQLRQPQICPDIMLAFAPVRKHRTTFIIEKATELGARTLQPIITARTQFPKFNVEKAKLQAVEAAEQTERLDIPDIRKPAKLDHDWLETMSDYSLIFADEAGDARPALDVLPTLPAPAMILIGPEGGFTERERDMLRGQDFVTPVSLGPRILRADTAALSLLTLWQAASGDWK